MLPFTEARNSCEREPDELEQSALAWVVRRDRGLAPPEASALARWLAAAPRHRELFDEFSGVWAIMRRFAPPPLVPAGPTPSPGARTRPACDCEAGLPFQLGGRRRARGTPLSPRQPRA